MLLIVMNFLEVLLIQDGFCSSGNGTSRTFQVKPCGNYLKFYDAIKGAYDDIKIITNSDAFPSTGSFGHTLKLQRICFLSITRSANGPKAFVSEYSVSGSDAGYGNLKAAIGEAAFLIGLELISDVVEMASYAPLFVNSNHLRWSPDSIVFNSWQQYGTPSYWMQHVFRESNGCQFWK